MCGIVGTISSLPLSYAATNIFKYMLQMDIIRGKDSVGMISQTGDKITCAKSVMSPTDFLDSRRVTPILTGQVKALVGHNRHATKGAVTANNAHPFEHGPISLVHNGTLTYPMPQHSTDFDTDSEAIAYNLSLIEPDQAGDFIATLNGAFTLVWYDARDKSWNLIRNEERPLNLMQNTTGTVLYLSSEVGILYAATTKEKMVIDPETHIFELPVGQLWKYTTVAGVLQRGVQNVTLKKRTVLPATTSTAGTIQSRNTTTGTTKYNGGVEDFQREMGMLPGFYPCTVMEFKPNQYNKATGELRLMLDQAPWNDIIMYGVKEPTTDQVEVKLSTLWYAVANNKQAKDRGDFVLTSSEYRPIQEKKNLPVVIEHGGEVNGNTLPSADEPVDVVMCEACEQDHNIGLCAQLNDATFVCSSCIKDPMIADHCAKVGMLFNFGDIK